jgi:hypothetical protein
MKRKIEKREGLSDARLYALLVLRSRVNCAGGCSLRFLLAPLAPCASLLTEFRKARRDRGPYESYNVMNVIY